MAEFRFPSHTGECEIYTRMWTPEGMPRGVIQLIHGMAEYIGRYDEFARYLTGLGFAVAGDDHAGHGESLPDEAHKGFFAHEDGWSKLVEDEMEVYRRMKLRYPDIPYVIFGHSMGSFLARTVASRYPEAGDAYVFCGTAGRNPALKVGLKLARHKVRTQGAMADSPLLDKIAFGSYSKGIANRRTPFDWLTRDHQVVERYVEDPLCGFLFKAGGFRDLFEGLHEVSQEQWPQMVPQKPILMIAGERDPVGAYGKGVRQVARALEESGHDVRLRLYPGGRHEILNEINRQEVYKDVGRFLEEKVMV